MANIVELRGRSNEQLLEMIENNREEMFNLRFQKAMARLNNTSRIREVRREIAQVQTVLDNRQLAIAEAAAHASIADALPEDWEASAQYVYEDQGFQVEFTSGGSTVATALVNLSKKLPRTRRERANKGTVERVVRYEVK